MCCLTLLGETDSSARSDSFNAYVDPEIGTAHSCWFFHTPAANPFGMAKPAASTDGHYGNPSGWEAVGYDPRHESIESFVNFHEFHSEHYPGEEFIITVDGDPSTHNYICSATLN